MMWFTASILIAIKPENYTGGSFEVYEDMYLLEAPSGREAMQKAEQLGREYLLIDDGLTIDGVPATRSFIGIRKLISVCNPTPLAQDEERPVSGTEVTYALYRVANDAAATKLANGKKVNVVYLE